MEEEKATDYYNELLRKGGNAAKFKQGLGFGTQATSLSKRTSVPEEEKSLSLSNFVKESGTGKAIVLDEKIRIKSIVDKLKKPGKSSLLECRSSTRTYPERIGVKSSDGTNSKGYIGGKTLYSCESESAERVREKSGSSRRLAPVEETERAPAKKSSGKERRGRSRDRSRISGRKFSRSSSDNNSSKSPAKCMKRSTRRGSDGSASSIDDNRSRHGRKRQGRAYSRHEIRRKERCRSPPSHRNAFHNHTGNWSTERSGISGSNRERERERDRRDERPSGRQREWKNAARDSSHGSRAKETAADWNYSEPEWDYSKLRPNVDTMTPGEKFKAKTKLQFSDTVMKDPTMGTSNGWERFDFDKNAPLDDDAKLDHFGDTTGANDDTLFLKNTGSSYLSSHSQVKRESLTTAKHESSIFGVPEGPSVKILERARDLLEGKTFRDGCESSPRESGIDVGSINEERDCKSVTPSMGSVLSEQVLAMQQAGSWQDRAQKMKNARVKMHY